jgi:hypothetical protein
MLLYQKSINERRDICSVIKFLKNIKKGSYGISSENSSSIDKDFVGSGWLYRYLDI